MKCPKSFSFHSSCFSCPALASLRISLTCQLPRAKPSRTRSHLHLHPANRLASHLVPARANPIALSHRHELLQREQAHAPTKGSLTAHRSKPKKEHESQRWPDRVQCVSISHLLSWHRFEAPTECELFTPILSLLISPYFHPLISFRLRSSCLISSCLILSHLI